MFCVVNYNRLKLYKDKTRYTYKMSDTTIKIDRNLYPTYADYYVSPQYRKDYYQLNKKVIAEKNKKRYEENKEKIKEKAAQKLKCEYCGKEVRRDGLKKHQENKSCREKRTATAK